MALGKVVLVGAGPGDMDLLTIKAKKYIQIADCIIYDRLVNKKLLAIARKDSERIFVGKANHHHTMPQQQINELLVSKAKEHKLIVRLKGGDPYVFGRGGEEALYLLENNIEVDVVPGVSSSIAALESAGIPITHRGLSKGFQVITAHSKKDEPADIDYSLLQDETVTLVFLMGLSHVKDISEGLIKAGRSKDTPVAVISQGTANTQKVAKGTLATIRSEVEQAALESPATIVVGEVVGLSDKLNFFEQRPLFGKKFFLPTIEGFDYSLGKGRSPQINSLEKSLEDAGAQVLSLKAGQILPIELDLSFLADAKKQTCIVFTSANGVKAFFWNLFEVNHLDNRAISSFSFAVIGEKTAKTLRDFGFNADIISTRQTGKDLAEKLNSSLAAETSIYWFCQSNSSEDFESTLSSSFHMKKYICYDNRGFDIVYTDEIKEEISKCDAAVFTSGSNARFAISNFLEYLPSTIYSIGPACSKAIENAGKEVKEAAISSYDGLLQLVGEIS